MLGNVGYAKAEELTAYDVGVADGEVHSSQAPEVDVHGASENVVDVVRILPELKVM